jgi:hypothetical protein
MLGKITLVHNRVKKNYNYMGDISGLIGTILTNSHIISLDGKNFKIIGGTISKEALAKELSVNDHLVRSTTQYLDFIFPLLNSVKEEVIHIKIKINSSSDRKHLDKYLKDNGLKLVYVGNEFFGKHTLYSMLYGGRNVINTSIKGLFSALII